MQSSDAETVSNFRDSNGESNDEAPAVEQERVRRFLFLRRVHNYLDRLEARRRALHLRRLARRERRRNQRILALERRTELRGRLNYSAQLRALTGDIASLTEENAVLRNRIRNILTRTSAIARLNDRIVRRNRYLQERLNRLYVILRPAVYYHRIHGEQGTVRHVD